MELSENLTHNMPVVTHMIHVSLALCGKFKQAPVTTLLKKPTLLTFLYKVVERAVFVHVSNFLLPNKTRSQSFHSNCNHSAWEGVQLSLYWGTTRIGAWSSLLNIHHHPWSICSHVFITISLLLILSSLILCWQKTSLSWCGSQIWPTNFRWFSLVIKKHHKDQVLFDWICCSASCTHSGHLCNAITSHSPRQRPLPACMVKPLQMVLQS